MWGKFHGPPIRLLNVHASAGILTRAFVSLAYVRFHKVR